MLEKMGEFFDRRLADYEAHQLTAIAGAAEFYPFTASLLPRGQGVRVLDLGCGTGLELGYYFQLAPHAAVTGIDLAPGMLAALAARFRGRDLTLILGSYFDIPLPEERFDAAVSVESLHHFTKAEKLPLYRKVRRALKPGGCLILTDYFAASDAEEVRFRRALRRLRAEQNIPEGEFCHYDTPLTVSHETQALREAGFSTVEVLGRWENTRTLRAER